MSARDLVELSCKEVVELVTEYVEAALDEGDRVKFEQHLFGCTWCMTHLKQVDRTRALTKQLARPEPVDTKKLAALFQQWKQNK